MFKKRKSSIKILLKLGDKQQKRPQLYTPKYKLQKWRRGERDKLTNLNSFNSPSVPHAHAKDTGYRLNAWTGDIYPAGNERKKIIGKLKKKELSTLHSDPDFLDFARKQIIWYQSEYPNIKFYVPDWFQLKTRQPRMIKKEMINEVGDFAFIGSAIIRN